MNIFCNFIQFLLQEAWWAFKFTFPIIKFEIYTIGTEGYCFAC